MVLKFKNENDKVILSKNVKLDYSVKDLMNIQKENLWVSIEIPQVELLDNMDFMDVGDNKIRMTYSFSIDELLPINRIHESVPELLEQGLLNKKDIL